jgi:hypothetical protein
MPNGGKPGLYPGSGVPQDFSEVVKFYYPPDDYDFSVLLSGKQKVIDLPGQERVIQLSPGLKATFTNNETNESVTVNISGPVLVTTHEDGTKEYVGTGRNFNGDPEIRDGEGGLALTSGRITWTTDSTGAVIIEPLSGGGRVTDFFDLFF